MILLLESGKNNLVNIEKGESSTFSAEEISSKVLDYLHLSSLEHYSKINRIFLINLTEHEITEADIANYQKNKYFISPNGNKFGKQYPIREKDFLSTIQIFNKSDLEKENKFDISVLLKRKGSEGILCYSVFLSPLLADVLNNIEGSELYAKSYFNLEIKGSPDIVKIINVKEYLNFYIKLTEQQNRDFETYHNIPELFSEAFILVKRGHDPQIEQRYFHDAFISLSQKEKIKFLLVGGDKYLTKKFISEVENKLGIFDYRDCISRTYKLNIRREGCVFHNVQRLSPDVLLELLTELSGRKYQRKVIILISDSIINAVSKFDFQIVRVPDYEDCKNYLNIFIALMLREKNMLHLPGDIVQRIVFLRIIKSTYLNEFLRIIPSLSEIDEILEYIKYAEQIYAATDYIDFWYGFKKYVGDKYQNLPVLNEPLVQNQQVTEKNEPILQNQAVDEKYVFIKRENGKYRIIFNGQEIALKNEGIDGLYYIHKIISTVKLKPIHVQDLYGRKENLQNNLMSKMKKMRIGDLDGFNQQDPLGDIIDSKAIKDIKEKTEKLEQELKKLDEHDYKRKEEIEIQIKELSDYVRKNMNNKGKPRKFRGTDSKIQNTINNALKRVHDEIQDKYPAFYDFLKTAIRYNDREYSYSYTPPTKIDWILK